MNTPVILYVEDNHANRQLVKRILEVEGYTVLEAHDGQQGLDLARSHKPDLILMDINLPEMDGYTVTAKIREMDAMGRTPIIALTANVMRGDREKSLNAGCDGYIRKPINIDQLPEQVAHFLDVKKALASA